MCPTISVKVEVQTTSPQSIFKSSNIPYSRLVKYNVKTADTLTDMRLRPI